MARAIVNVDVDGLATVLDISRTSADETNLVYALQVDPRRFEILADIVHSSQDPLTIVRAFKEAFQDLERQLTQKAPILRQNHRQSLAL